MAIKHILISTYQSFGELTAIAVDAGERIWAGFDQNGFKVFSSNRYTFEEIYQNSDNSISTIFCDPGASIEILLGCSDGTVIYYAASSDFSNPVIFDDLQNCGSINSLAFDHSFGFVYAGVGGYGVFALDESYGYLDSSCNYPFLCVLSSGTIVFSLAESIVAYSVDGLLSGDSLWENFDAAWIVFVKVKAEQKVTKS